MGRSRISTVCFKRLCAYLLQLLSKVQSILNIQFSSVKSLSFVRLFPTLCSAARQGVLSLSITNSRSLPKPMSIESVMPSSLNIGLAQKFIWVFPYDMLENLKKLFSQYIFSQIYILKKKKRKRKKSHTNKLKPKHMKDPLSDPPSP